MSGENDVLLPSMRALLDKLNAAAAADAGKTKPLEELRQVCAQRLSFAQTCGCRMGKAGPSMRRIVNKARALKSSSA